MSLKYLIRNCFLNKNDKQTLIDGIIQKFKHLFWWTTTQGDFSSNHTIHVHCDCYMYNRNHILHLYLSDDYCTNRWVLGLYKILNMTEERNEEQYCDHDV